MTTKTLALSGLIASLLLGGLALSSTGCAGSRYHRSTGAYLDDKGVSTRVKTALFRDPLVSGFDVHVNTYRGDVQLSGFVDTQEQKDRAAAIARGVEGVAAVTNNLEVKPKAAVGTAGGTVQGSSGTVKEPLNEPVTERPAADLNRTGEPAPKQLAPERPSSDIDRTTPPRTDNLNTTTAMPETGALDHVEINIADGKATIRGTVANDSQKRDIERHLKEMPGVTSVDNKLDVR